MRHVLDASVAVPWFFLDEPARDVALSIRTAIRDRPQDFVVPPLFHSELLHVLARKSDKDTRFVRAAIRLARLVRDDRFDVVHVHGPLPSIVARLP